MDLEVKKALADAMFNYSSNQLKNNAGFEPFEDMQTNGYAVVDIRFDPQGKFRITKAETYERQLAETTERLENATNELREAKKTIGKQEKQIESFKKEAKKSAAKAVPKKTEKVKDTSIILEDH